MMDLASGCSECRREARFRQLALQGLTIHPETKICCGSGQATQVLVQYSQNVTGLDAHHCR